jgi:hypothetical protein
MSWPKTLDLSRSTSTKHTSHPNSQNEISSTLRHPRLFTKRKKKKTPPLLRPRRLQRSRFKFSFLFFFSQDPPQSHRERERERERLREMGLEIVEPNTCVRGCCASKSIPLHLPPSSYTLLSPIARGNHLFSRQFTLLLRLCLVFIPKCT